MYTTDDQQELFIVVDTRDRIIGYRTRYDCHHDRRLIHRGANLVIFDDQGRMLLQKRSMTKDIRPGYWQNAVGGHVTKGESYKKAIQRELEEELGIKASVRFYNKFLFTYANETEMEAVYTAKCNGPFHPNQTEVDQVMFISKDELQRNHSSGTVKLTELAEHIFKLVGYL
ncbi:hypothetical protein A2973_02615 [Candidatus Gottesmanbacteria bacterium RIFCSPLOWO2_01_FULL_49_10]|uniref:Nudix hydrolase domain-containing protein n=1 Tax=Candidatus Gottesmanbacteria bacterium RIFCSPLOWO2_01_FULL_49_10 TaxID=1798396 RepID=A0A1F6B1I1_9BACT|nr:MAG: NUDIX hydrolase [Microgenomates group bacterium GW2011_GWA2_47_8]OGG30791.1 MAG: hypothetical protein A2973_02615 [Candidatus Gottesmanbacteria bacterium RIFCSPLOWO2_01_FULL_49_10]HCM68667.1 hypothetical protein [Candidatus Kerfeldbacteria bacterium]